ncbi:hypothetical protein BGX31_007090 [Mortierella sp. GBA43]|nr:hypothetical protein BGX31_007090 [Mortierella sp. GBA43]
MAYHVSDMTDQVSPSESSVAVTSTGNQGSLSSQHPQFAQEFWEEQVVAAEQFDSDFKNHLLPLARIKKVMKSDPEVKMISAEVPILFSKACEIFICEITRRAWLHAEESKRRTLQKIDVATAASRSDQFDFLIDIVPREDSPKSSKRSTTHDNTVASSEDQQQQQQQQYSQYGQYYHAEGSPFYQSMSPEQFQQYMQYQHQAIAQYHSQQQHQPSTSRGSPMGHAGQEPTSRQS